MTKSYYILIWVFFTFLIVSNLPYLLAPFFDKINSFERQNAELVWTTVVISKLLFWSSFFIYLKKRKLNIAAIIGFVELLLITLVFSAYVYDPYQNFGISISILSIILLLTVILQITFSIVLIVNPKTKGLLYLRLFGVFYLLDEVFTFLHRIRTDIRDFHLNLIFWVLALILLGLHLIKERNINDIIQRDQSDILDI